MKVITACVLLFLLSVSTATIFYFPIDEQKDFGLSYEDALDNVTVSMDCETNILTIHVKDEDQPVTGAMVRLLYVDYSTPLLSAGPTDADGRFSYRLVGNKSYMLGLFNAVIEKEGHKNKEAHFDIYECVYPPPPLTTPAEEEEEEEETPPQPPEETEHPPAEPPVQNASGNATINATDATNASGTNMTNATGPAGEDAAGICPVSLFVLLIPLFCTALTALPKQ